MSRQRFEQSTPGRRSARFGCLKHFWSRLSRRWWARRSRVRAWRPKMHSLPTTPGFSTFEPAATDRCLGLYAKSARAVGRLWYRALVHRDLGGEVDVRFQGSFYTSTSRTLVKFYCLPPTKFFRLGASHFKNHRFENRINVMFVMRNVPQWARTMSF